MNANEARNKFFEYIIRLNEAETEEACEDITEELEKESLTLLGPIEDEIKEFLDKADVNPVNKMIANLYVCLSAITSALVLQSDPCAYSPKVQKAPEKPFETRLAELLKKASLT